MDDPFLWFLEHSSLKSFGCGAFSRDKHFFLERYPFHLHFQIGWYKIVHGMMDIFDFILFLLIFVYSIEVIFFLFLDHIY